MVLAALVIVIKNIKAMMAMEIPPTGEIKVPMVIASIAIEMRAINCTKTKLKFALVASLHLSFTRHAERLNAFATPVSS